MGSVLLTDAVLVIRDGQAINVIYAVSRQKRYCLAVGMGLVMSVCIAGGIRMKRSKSRLTQTVPTKPCTWHETG